ncbi:hypothetical protein DFH09DRAFT_1035185 [Mycena vulgaris]|nr:hypothetical protein DFH09DRAFT_1035185 [Mycena vulgaris]
MYPSRSSGAPPAYDAPAGSYAAPWPSANYRQAGAIDDRTPRLPQPPTASNLNDKTKWDIFPVYLLFISLLLVGVISEWKRSEDALDPATRDRLRREWDKEVRAHEKTRQAWNSEVAAHETLRVGWENERRENERREILAMREQLVRDREIWAHECEQEKREEASRKRDEADRVRAAFYWDGLRMEQRCLRHGARQYSARIYNVPRGYDPLQACTETSVEIHGLKIPTPTQCEDRGCGGVFGHWTVDYSEPTCKTHFENFKDKGCNSSGSGRRRIESRLENLQSGDDWRDMCSTTPADFRHLHFESPEMCEHRGIYGVWGIWMIEDQECLSPLVGGYLVASFSFLSGSPPQPSIYCCMHSLLYLNVHALKVGSQYCRRPRLSPSPPPSSNDFVVTTSLSSASTAEPSPCPAERRRALWLSARIASGTLVGVNWTERRILTNPVITRTAARP